MPYGEQFQKVVAIIESARERAYRKVNEELILMYRDIGEYISKQSENAEYGDAFVQKLADFFAENYPDLKGLSNFDVPNFLEQMKSVVSESYRVLKKGKFCAVLMGDTRQKGHVIPMSFEVMKIFEAAGFKTKEIIIKEQHNCRATGYWKTNSVKYNFLLLAHEYLFAFRK